VPQPTAADNHQWSNARAFEQTGAALVLDQKNSSSEKVVETLLALAGDEPARAKIQAALAQWHVPAAAENIAGNILNAIGQAATALPASARSGGGEIKLRVVT
jgi:UDP-N-acetylglucosamine--N-acetylmuramyl-(pentapeptide) pyrophosphoryl-undecaprenol N-acetylglucosamine transferase